VTELEGPPGEVDEVAAHVTGNTVSKFPTAVPVEVPAFPVSLIVSALRCGAEPDIPIDEIGHGLGFKDGFTNGTDAAVAPDVGFFDFTNPTRSDSSAVGFFVGFDYKKRRPQKPPSSSLKIHPSLLPPISSSYRAAVILLQEFNYR
jgi:hypothetical protein